jgi:signal transduction histidine kinase
LRLLSILLDNAGKYTPPGGAVRLKAVLEESKISISVEDTGIGISREDQARVFDRFFRVARSDGGMLAGSGLGLALAKWITERHGTELALASEPAVGSCFSFSLRLQPTECSEDLQARSFATG